jgi:hypothetical protein
MLTAIRNSSATMVPRSAQQPCPTSMTMDICGPGNVSHLTTSFGRQRQRNAHYIKQLLDIASDLQDKAHTFSRLVMQPRRRRNHANFINFIALAVAVGLWLLARNAASFRRRAAHAAIVASADYEYARDHALRYLLARAAVVDGRQAVDSLGGGGE